jgi:outer membrane lipoprotein-sorting protein
MRSLYAGGLWLAVLLAPARADSLEDVLARMDSAAKSFKSYSATITRLDYTKVIDETDESHGSMRLKSGKNGIIGIMDVTSGPDHTILHFNGGTVDRYLPKAGTVEQYNAKKFASTLDQMLLLGFAVTRDAMNQDYDIKLAGPEKIGTVATTHLVLTPKSAEALKYVKTIELWIPDGKGNPIRQKGTEPSGNYKLATFTNLQLNPPLPDSDFELAVPPGVKRVKEN